MRPSSTTPTASKPRDNGAPCRVGQAVLPGRLERSTPAAALLVHDAGGDEEPPELGPFVGLHHPPGLPRRAGAYLSGDAGGADLVGQPCHPADRGRIAALHPGTTRAA